MTKIVSAVMGQAVGNVSAKAMVLPPLTPSQQAARREIEGLVEGLRLPARVAGAEYLESRHIWFEALSDYYRALKADS